MIYIISRSFKLLGIILQWEHSNLHIPDRVSGYHFLSSERNPFWFGFIGVDSDLHLNGRNSLALHTRAFNLGFSCVEGEFVEISSFIRISILSESCR